MTDCTKDWEAEAHRLEKELHILKMELAQIKEALRIIVGTYTAKD